MMKDSSSTLISYTDNLTTLGTNSTIASIPFVFVTRLCKSHLLLEAYPEATPWYVGPD